MSSLNGIGVGIPYATYEGTGSITDSSTFYAPLETSLILQRGTGDPTWSRATKAWGFNELGYLEEIASGCAFFGGARLVRNRLGGNSDNFSSGVPNSVTIVNASEPNHRGTNTAVRYAVTPGLDYHFVRSNILAADYPGGATLRSTVVVSRNLYRYIGIRAGQTSGSEVIDLQTNTWVTNRVETLHRSFEIIDANWIRLTTSAYFAATTTKVFDITPASPTGLEYWTAPAGLEFVIADAQLNNISNYDASYVPEYVSVGVVASPFFGAGIDGAKYFNTGWNGAPLTLQGFRREAAATNNLLYNRTLDGRFATSSYSSSAKAWIPTTTGSELVTNGTFASDVSGWTAENSVVTWSAGKMRVVTVGANGWAKQILSLTVGKTYLITASSSVIAGGVTNASIRIHPDTSSASIPVKMQLSVTGTDTYALIFTATAASQLLLAQNGFNSTIEYDDISVKEATMSVSPTATGLDGIANTATTLTATAADAIILQPTSGIASAARCASAYVKRRTGTGTISFTQDGGSTWTDITSLINSSTWSRVQITATLANPSVGFKISTSGDAIDVDVVQNEAGTVATSPIVTTTATVTRNAESLTYQTASNIDFAVGTVYCETQFTAAISTRRAVAIGPDGHSYINSGDANTLWKAYDGTNIVSKSGLSDISTAKRKRVVSWGTGLKVTGDGISPASGSFDGAFGSGASIEIGQFINGYIGPVAIYNYQMTDAELQAITS